MIVNKLKLYCNRARENNLLLLFSKKKNKITPLIREKFCIGNFLWQNIILINLQTSILFYYYIHHFVFHSSPKTGRRCWVRWGGLGGTTRFYFKAKHFHIFSPPPPPPHREETLNKKTQLKRHFHNY